MVTPSLSLYFHIPFCSKKCPYCHFFVVTQKDRYEKRFLSALKREWQQKNDRIQSRFIQSLYFGGGTPSELSAESLYDLVSFFTQHHAEAKEITVEMNPETVSVEKVAALKAAGVNRVSLGIQSLVDTELIILKRQHHKSKALSAIDLVYTGGIHNITIDLMYDLPTQTAASFSKTLDQLADLPIKHLSLYNLVFEDGTAYKKREKEFSPLLPLEEESLQMLEKAIDKLESLGLMRYEISAFAKKGYESNHNLGYWTGRPFLGLGPSAFSYDGKRRFQNVCHMDRYLESVENNLDPKAFEECLDPLAHIKELFAIRLRVFEPIDLAVFESAQGKLPDELLSELKQLSLSGYIDYNPNTVKLTPKGALFFDSVASALI